MWIPAKIHCECYQVKYQGMSPHCPAGEPQSALAFTCMVLSGDSRIKSGAAFESWHNRSAWQRTAIRAQLASRHCLLSKALTAGGCLPIEPDRLPHCRQSVAVGSIQVLMSKPAQQTASSNCPKRLTGFSIRGGLVLASCRNCVVTGQHFRCGPPTVAGLVELAVRRGGTPLRQPSRPVLRSRRRAAHM